MAVISPITTQAPVASAPAVSAPVSSAHVSSAVAGAPSAAAVRTAPAQQEHGSKQAVAEKPVQEKDVQQAINQANETLALQGSNESIAFTYEAKLGQLYVQIKDQTTGDVVREIPSKDFIKHQIAIREMIGLLLDKKG